MQCSIANGLPIRLALTTGEAHDNRLADKLLIAEELRKWFTACRISA
jgi:hypothetical protein